MKKILILLFLLLVSCCPRAEAPKQEFIIQKKLVLKNKKFDPVRQIYINSTFIRFYIDTVSGSYLEADFDKYNKYNVGDTLKL